MEQSEITKIGADQPSCRLLLRSKEGIEVFPIQSSRDQESCVVPKNDRKFLLKGETSFQELLPDGSAVIVHRRNIGLVKVNLDGDNSSVENEYVDPFFEKTSCVQIMHVSPKGTFLLTWERSDGNENNLKVFNTTTGKYIIGFQRKSINRSFWPPLQWTSDEKFAFLLSTNEIRIYNGIFPDTIDSRYFDKIRIPGIASMSFPSSEASSGGDTILFVAFVAKDKNKPSRASLYEYSQATASQSPYPAIASKSLFQAEEMKVYWSPRGDIALISLQSSVDNTGESYYGSSSLYLMSKQSSNDAIAVPLPQDGPVLDVGWNPNPTQPPCFVVVAGRMPAMASLHNGYSGTPTFLFGNRHQNTVSWSPHGRFVNLAGFGNLAGGMTFWDKNKGKQIPPANPIVASCAVGYGWSDDSRLFAVSTTSPRMNVSNSVHVYRYNGDKVNTVPWINDNYLPDRLLQATFIPASDIVYPDRPQSPSLKDLGTGTDALTTSSGGVATKQTRYIPPSARNRAGRGGGNSLADRIRAEKDGKIVGAQKIKNAKKQNLVGVTGKVVVGLAPSDQKEGKSKSALRRQKQQQQKKEEEARKEYLKAQDAAKPVDPVKRTKKINKILRQIDELKQKDPSVLNEDQIKKIGTEQDLRKELSELQV